MRLKLFKENSLDLDAECEAILVFLFTDYQKLYHQKELAFLDKTSTSLYQKLMEKVKTAAQ
jgi:hypothetical protein